MRADQIIFWTFTMGNLGLGFYIKYKCSKYEFENRTAVGVIQFETYGASVRHSMKKMFANLMIILGIIIGTVGFLRSVI